MSYYRDIPKKKDMSRVKHGVATGLCIWWLVSKKKLLALKIEKPWITYEMDENSTSNKEQYCKYNKLPKKGTQKKIGQNWMNVFHVLNICRLRRSEETISTTAKKHLMVRRQIFCAHRSASQLQDLEFPKKLKERTVSYLSVLDKKSFSRSNKLEAENGVCCSTMQLVSCNKFLSSYQKELAVWHILAYFSLSQSCLS